MSTETAICEIEKWAGQPLPVQYRELLPNIRNQVIGDRVYLYPPAIVIERNETYETRKYCPGYITIGDDSGGSAFVIALADEACEVYLVDHGSMDPECFESLGTCLREWIQAQCPLK